MIENYVWNIDLGSMHALSENPWSLDPTVLTEIFILRFTIHTAKKEGRMK